MSTPNALELAALPTALGVVNAMLAFNANMGPDPAKWAGNFPGSWKICLGQIELLLPGLATAEGGAVLTAANAQLASWASAIKAIQASAPPAA